jgi:nitroreductase
LKKESRMFKDLVLQNRSCRRFYQEVAIEKETLRELVDLARCSASSGNRQPLKYILSCEPEETVLIFELIGFARKDPKVRYPPEGERPSAYIIILGDKTIRETFVPDHGIAAQSILLGARERGLGGCMVGMVAKDEMNAAFQIPAHFQILLVVALGKPKEEAVIETIGKDGDTKAYWDDAGVRHVPKRSLDDIIIASYATERVAEKSVNM